MTNLQIFRSHLRIFYLTCRIGYLRALEDLRRALVWMRDRLSPSDDPWYMAGFHNGRRPGWWRFPAPRWWNLVGRVRYAHGFRAACRFNAICDYMRDGTSFRSAVLSEQQERKERRQHGWAAVSSFLFLPFNSAVLVMALSQWPFGLSRATAWILCFYTFAIITAVRTFRRAYKDAC